MNKQINQIVQLIKKHDKIAFFGHVKPDPDSISCSYGLALAVKEVFPEKKVVFVSDYLYLQKHFPGVGFNPKIICTKIGKDFLTVTGDGAIKKRVEFFEEFNKGKQKIAFDHHQNTTNMGLDVFWHEPSYPASALQASEIAFALRKSFSEETSFALSLGLLSDTGHFVFSMANPAPVKMYGKLLENISDQKMDLYFKKTREKPPFFIKAQRFLLSHVRFSQKVAYVVVPRKILSRYEEFNFKLNIHTIGNIQNFPVWLLVFEKNQGWKYELHIRSNGPQVNVIATKHHGGGHVRAAGAKAANKKELSQIIQELDNT